MTAVLNSTTEADAAEPAPEGFAFIPLTKLAISPQNIRRTDRKVDLDALAASIKSLGLLQNLAVTRSDGDRFTVVAGGRRLAALAKQGAIARDFSVPCNTVDDGTAIGSSLAENVQRVAADAMDEVDAFAALKDQGFNPPAIAQRFGCAIRHVVQRLALAALSPKLKAAYRKGDLSLDAARAFCIEPDHARQEAVFKALGKPVMHTANVRAHLTHGRMRGTDRLARFVGLEAYEAAGGSLTRDLFLASEIYVDDPALVSRLATEKLEDFREDLLAKGWGWVNVNLGHGRFERASGQRVQPTRRQPNAEEAETLAKLEADIEDLQSALDGEEDQESLQRSDSPTNDNDDPSWADRDRLDAEHQALIETLTIWNPEEIALAGVVISVEHDGRLCVAYGVVAKADAAKLTKLRRQRDEATAKRLRARSEPITANGAEDDVAQSVDLDAVDPVEDALARSAGRPFHNDRHHDKSSRIMTEAPIQIRNPDVVRDIRALAERLGLPMTDVVADAVRRRLAEELAQAHGLQSDRKQRALDVLARIDALPKRGESLTDADLYDANGLPIGSAP